MKKFYSIFLAVLIVSTLIISSIISVSAVGEPAKPLPTTPIDKLIFSPKFYDENINVSYYRVSGADIVTVLSTLYGGSHYFADNGIGFYYPSFNSTTTEGYSVYELPYTVFSPVSDSYIVMFAKIITDQPTDDRAYFKDLGFPSILSGGIGYIDTTAYSPRFSNVYFRAKNDQTFGAHTSTIQFGLVDHTATDFSHNKYSYVFEGAYIIEGAANVVKFLNYYEGINVPYSIISSYQNTISDLQAELDYYKGIVNSPTSPFLPYKDVTIACTVEYHNEFQTKTTYTFTDEYESPDPHFYIDKYHFLAELQEKFTASDVIDSFKISVNFGRTFDLKRFMQFTNLYLMDGDFQYMLKNASRTAYKTDFNKDITITMREETIVFPAYAYSSTPNDFYYDTFLFNQRIESPMDYQDFYDKWSVFFAFSSLHEYEGGIAFAIDVTNDVQYLEGYQDGTKYGYDDGYKTGYAEGAKVSDAEKLQIYDRAKYDILQNADDYKFTSLIGAVVDAPVHLVQSCLSFEILGINIAGLLFGILSVVLVFLIIKKFV